MKQMTRWAVLVVFAFWQAPLLADEDADEARERFERVVKAINEQRFDPIKNIIDRTDMTNRILNEYAVSEEVRAAFSENFWEMVEGIALGNAPNAETKVPGKLIEFEFADGKGAAVVRYDLPNYLYTYQIWELRHDNRKRLKAVDWHDTTDGMGVVSEISESLVTMMPSRASTSQLLSGRNPTDQQLFQTTELLKAARDRQAPRFFEIYDGIDSSLKNDKLISKFAVQLAFLAQDPDRFRATLDTFASVHGGDKKFAMPIANSYLVLEEYDKAYASMQQFFKHFDIKEGGTPAKLSALALVLGLTEDAEKYAVIATTAEPTLELGWWSLLRARARSGNFSGAVEALTRLEDDFDEVLDAANLKRDRFGGFVALSESDEFKAWRETR